MECKFCNMENEQPPKEGKDRNGVQRYRCRFCHRVFPDPIELEKNRKRAKNKPCNKNKFDEYIVLALSIVFKDYKNLNGIKSSRSIAGLVERPASTVQYWLKKHKENYIKPSTKMTKNDIINYVNSKKFGFAILYFLQLRYERLQKLYKQIENKILNGV